MKRPKIEDFDQDGLKDFVLIDYKVALEEYCDELTSENEKLNQENKNLKEFKSWCDLFYPDLHSQFIGEIKY